MGENELGLRYWTSRRLSRRRVLAGAAAGGAALAAIGLVGCRSDGNGNGEGGIRTTTVTDGTQDGPGKPGGFLRTRQSDALPSMNPFGPGIFALAQGLFLGFTVFDHMWYVPTDTGVLELFLATEVEQPDELTVIATLGEAVFHDKSPVDGRAVEPEDVAASYKRFREEAPVGYSWLHHVMDDVVGDSSARTVTITQRFPWAWVFTSSNAGSPISSSIIPREIHDDGDFLRQNAIGSGHWMLDGHENGANIRLRKHPNFRIPDQPLLDGINTNLILETTDAMTAFQANQLDTLALSTVRDAESLETSMGDRIVISTDLSRDYECLMITYQPPFLDPRVRQAINLLLDRDEMIQLLEFGSGEKAGPIPPAHRRFVLDQDELEDTYWKHDPQQARALFDATGFDMDQQIELKHSTRPHDASLAQVLKNQLERGGLRIRLIPEDLVKWFSETLNQGNFQLTAFRHLPYEDPDLPLRFFLSADPDRPNFMKYEDPEVDEAVLAAARELEEEQRVEKVREAQRTIIRQAGPMLNLFSRRTYGARYAYVKGTITGRGSYGLFNRTTWLDR